MQVRYVGVTVHAGFTQPLSTTGTAKQIAKKMWGEKWKKKSKTVPIHPV